MLWCSKILGGTPVILWVRDHGIMKSLAHRRKHARTQGQIVGKRESLNWRENMARRKVKNGEKSPWGQCLTRPVPNGRRRSAFWLGRKAQKFSGTNQKAERQRPFGTGLVRHCLQGLFSPFFTFLLPYSSARLDFPSPPLSAPGSPRMRRKLMVNKSDMF